MNKFQGCPKIFYINMNICEERNNYMINQFNELGITNYERFDALHEGNSKLNIIDIKRKHKPSIYYCLLSHITLIRKIYEEGLKEAIICEDDVDLRLSKYWNKSIREYIDKSIYETELDIINFFDSSLETNIIELKEYEQNKHWGASCYYITFKACEKIVNKLCYNLIKDKYYLNLRNYNKIEADILIFDLLKTYILPLTSVRLINDSNIHDDHLEYQNLVNTFITNYISKKKILFVFSNCIFKTNGGMEEYSKNLLKYIPSNKYFVNLLILNGEKKNIKGNNYNIIYDNYNELYKYVKHSDVIISQLEIAHFSLSLGLLYKKKCIYIHHGFYNSCNFEELILNDNIITIYNNPVFINHCKNHYNINLNLKNKYLLMPNIKFNKNNYMNDTYNNEYITYINLIERKGVNIFYKIVESMPERKFLAVKGWGDQIIKNYHNLTIIEPTDNIYNDVYKKTKLLISPTNYKESFGMAIAECCYLGIPVIANNIIDLHYTIGNNASYIKNNDDINEWINKIKNYDNMEYYKLMKNYYKKHIDSLIKEQNKQYYDIVNMFKSLC